VSTVNASIAAAPLSRLICLILACTLRPVNSGASFFSAMLRSSSLISPDNRTSGCSLTREKRRSSLVLSLPLRSFTGSSTGENGT